MSPRTASCGYINIGQPGNYTYHGEYAGQVEQVYNTCNGYVWAHWQWAGDFQRRHPGTDVKVSVGIFSPDASGPTQWTNDVPTSVKDVNSPGVPIHSANPDDWEAVATVNNCAPFAFGTLHWYGGADWRGPENGYC
ncbi:hypothetical protein OIU91_38770 [Streptomyces sp. NBC_01456]|uniref:hypothetical protein n=1 Tax=unclassified Streptomyces TaxID=2593676 RepID=UPI002E35351E|nr:MULTISPECIES: hypothetical protein [unclassified Streptomyces]